MKEENKGIPMYNSFAEMIAADPERVYRLWIYRKVYTPYEEQNAFQDESIFESTTAIQGRIRAAAVLPDGDLLIDFERDWDEAPYHEFYKLSEIRLESSALDQEGYADDDDYIDDEPFGDDYDDEYSEGIVPYDDDEEYDEPQEELEEGLCK